MIIRRINAKMIVDQTSFLATGCRDDKPNSCRFQRPSAFKDQTCRAARTRVRVTEESRAREERGVQVGGSKHRTKVESPDLSPKEDSRTIDRDECRRDGGDGPRPRHVLSPPAAQERTAAALHQVGTVCLVYRAIGCRTGNGEKLSSSQAGPGQAIRSAVA